jgi:predicted extracellular nuclease
VTHLTTVGDSHRKKTFRSLIGKPLSMRSSYDQPMVSHSLNSPFTLRMSAIRQLKRNALIATTILVAWSWCAVGPASAQSGAPVCESDPTTTVPAIQGTGPSAAITGPITVRGVVVGDYEGPQPALRGFFLQDLGGDENDETSDGIFVFNGAGTDLVNNGDVVQVKGTAGENQGQTQIALSSLEECGSTATVMPTDVSFPVESPEYLERYEGMLTHIPQTMTVTEHFQLGRFGQVVVSAGGRLAQPTQLFAPDDPRRADLQATNVLSRLIIDDADQQQNADPIKFARNNSPLSASNTLRGGDTLTDAVGVMTYTWGGNAASPNSYRLRPLQALNGSATFVEANSRPTTAPNVGGSAKVATLNLLNYFNTFGNGACSFGVGGAPADCRGANNANEFTRQSDKTVQAIIKLNADVQGIVEMENDGYGPDSAIQDLVDKLNAIQGADTWAFINPDAALDVTNAVSTDAIKPGILYQPARVTPVDGKTFSPTTSITFERRPLAQTFTDSTGATFTVVVNHFKSKGCTGASGADVDQNDGQGCFNARRTAQAAELLAFLNDVVVPEADDPDVLIVGDLNSYAHEEPISILAVGGYVDLVAASTEGAGYSYAFDGQWGTLDYALASPTLTDQITGASEFHINADEPDVLDYNTNFKSPAQVLSLYSSDEFRVSDHDPILLGIKPQAPGCG